VLGGDFNSSRSGSGANLSARTYLPQMAAAGVADTLLGSNPKYADRPLADTEARPLATKNANCMSHNGFLVAQRCDDPGLIGQHIDYLFGTSTLTVKTWEQVLDLDPANNWLGTIPSDHNLIRATVTLPPQTG
jgi:hypothetical protein